MESSNPTKQPDNVDAIVRELHHGVKNHLQIISSLLSLQTRYVNSDESVQVLRDTQQRIQVIGLAYELLYNSGNRSFIDFSLFVKKLLNRLELYCSNQQVIHLDSACEAIPLNIEKCVPAGLILNELVCNSIRHALPPSNCGQIHATIKCRESEEVIMVLRDNGKGYPADINLKEPDSMGLRIIVNLTKQLNGTIDFSSNGGACTKVIFRCA